MSVESPPSRQSLVVPPRGSSLSVALGAVVSAAVGFAAVWAIGLGRTTPRGPVDPAGRAAERVVADGVEASRADDSLPPGLSRETVREPRGLSPWPPTAPAVPSDTPDDTNGVRPASFEAPGRFTPADGEARPLSRFGAAATDTFTATVSGELSGAEPSEPNEQPAPEESEAAASPGPDDAASSITSPTDAPTAAAPADPFRASPPLDPPADGPQTRPQDAPQPNAVGGGDPSEVAPATDEPGAAPAPPAAAPSSVAAAQNTPVDDLLPPPGFAPTTPAADPASGPSQPLPANPAQPPLAAPPAASAFAAAPPLVPGAPPGLPTLPETAPFAAAVPSPSTGDGEVPGTRVPGGADGQGRPGPPQLDGLQSPQLAIEKRGPREIQVGKAARYEILLRNVGSAVARDVVLRDAIPYGTVLVTTTPPASPGETPDALVWRLGELPPGGQARVVVELMPQTEGEIGSVASVAFRADASVRSRATKPALAIECREPEAVRIGRDASLTITVSNPGSGTATGVVVEGALPETVSHRSGRDLEFDVGQLRPGESRSIDLVLGTTGPGVQPARFIARADGGIETERLVKLEVTAPTLEIEIDMPTLRFLQRPATCAISMVNAGTATARAVELAAQLPPGMKFVRANNAGWHDARTNRVLWNLEELPPGETGTVEVVVMPVELGPQKILAAARSADGPSDQVTHVCEVEGVAALSFEVTDSEDPIEISGVTEYVVRVRNHGTKAATGVQLAARLLGELDMVDARGPAGHRVENLVVFFEPIAKLAPSEDAVYRVRVRGRAAGSQRVQVQLTSEDQPAPITKEETTRVYDDR